MKNKTIRLNNGYPMEIGSSTHKVYKYILNKQDQGFYPTLKNICDLRSSRKDEIKVKQAELLVRSMGFHVSDYNEPTYQKKVMALKY